MTKAAALHKFFNSFGIPAYVSTSVVNENGEEDVTFPYLTYEYSVGGFDDTTHPTVRLYYYTESLTSINAKSEEISKVCHNGVPIRFDGGGAIIYSGVWDSEVDEVSANIKRLRSNFSINWISNT